MVKSWGDPCNCSILQTLDVATTQQGPSVQRHHNTSLPEDFFDSILNLAVHTQQIPSIPSIATVPTLRI